MYKERFIYSDFSLERYFSNKKHKITTLQLYKALNKCSDLASKCRLTGQSNSLLWLDYYSSCINNELKAVRLGITEYICWKDIRYMLPLSKSKCDDNITSTYIEDYNCEIPDEYVHTIAKARDIFNRIAVITTKNIPNGFMPRHNEAMLFGMFQNETNHEIFNRVYYLGYWNTDNIPMENVVLNV